MEQSRDKELRNGLLEGQTPEGGEVSPSATPSPEEACTGRMDDLPLLDASALAPGVLKRIVFGPGRFWSDWVMRYFILPPGEKVPAHSHDWEHLAVALQGVGRLVIDGVAEDFSQGRWGHVPAGRPHSFENGGSEPFAFLCIVPTSGDPHAKRAQHRLSRQKSDE